MSARTSSDVTGEIRAWMGRRAMSQSDLGRAIGVPPSWVNKRLHGVVPWTVDDLFDVAKALDVTPLVFFDPPEAYTELRPTRYSGIRQGTDASGSVRRSYVAA